MGLTAAAASFLLSAPVKAAEHHSNVKPAAITTTHGAGYFSGLETAMVKEDNEIQDAASVKTGLVKTEKGTFYYDAFGQKVTGLVEDESGTYLFDTDGNMLTGLQKVEDNTYLFDPKTGEMQTGTVKLNDKTYYLQDDGKLLTGWQEIDGKKYYYNTDGSLKKDAIEVIDGKRYSFDKDGAMEVNVTRGEFDFGADGVGVYGAGAYQKIADAALAQLGVTQDCTMLVTNSLKAVGINFHGGPLKYLSLGPTTNNPVPGDIIVYHGHVAIYIGNGKAVHGGWLGSQTVVSTVECDRQFVAFVHPTLPMA